jgi:hypothetical protein
MTSERNRSGLIASTTITYDLGRVIGTDQAGSPVTGICVHIHNGIIRTAYPVAP